MRAMNPTSFLIVTGCLAGTILLQAQDWPQWRGPTRDGLLPAAVWGEQLSDDSLQRIWRSEYGNSYSGPIVVGDRVFVTESKNDIEEHVYALDRATGKEIWHTQWEGFVKVPFFAKRSGNWIRSTPAFSDGKLYVAGMRDHLVCLDATTGKIIWDKDFVKEFGAPVPDFGFVSSPLVSGEAVYVQAGASVVKLDKNSGKLLWKTLDDGGGMWGSAFSSPVLATIAAKEQLIVQTRQELCGVDPDDGRVLWKQPVKAFRGMNILTPVVQGDRIFTTSYGGKAHQFEVSQVEGSFRVREIWATRAEGYMSSPVLVDGHLYLHLRNRRFTCINWDSGEVTWESNKKFGEYWSVVSNGKRILALDEDRQLYLIGVNPKQFELIGTHEVAESETWAHLAVSGHDLFVRDLDGITAFRWDQPAESVTSSSPPQIRDQEPAFEGGHTDASFTRLNH